MPGAAASSEFEWSSGCLASGHMSRDITERMELRGLEPLTYALPARRSGQLSYSPVECEVVCKVNACPLAVAGGGDSEVDDGPVCQESGRQREATVVIATEDGEHVDLVLGVCAKHVTA